MTCFQLMMVCPFVGLLYNWLSLIIPLLEFQATPFAAAIPHCLASSNMLSEYDDYEAGELFTFCFMFDTL